MVVISFYWWMIPAFITIAGLVWALYIYDDGGGYGSGIGNMLMLIPVLTVSCLSWIVYAIFK